LGIKRCFKINLHLHLLDFKHTLGQITGLFFLVVLLQTRLVDQDGQMELTVQVSPGLSNHFQLIECDVPGQARPGWSSHGPANIDWMEGRVESKEASTVTILQRVLMHRTEWRKAGHK
jgi:hypothetical protein